MNSPLKNLFASLPACAPGCCRQALRRPLSIAFAAVALGALSASAQTVNTFTNTANDGNYNNPANWSDGKVPNVSNNGERGDRAVINTNVAVTYFPDTPAGATTPYPGGDYSLDSGATLDLQAGSFTQAGSATSSGGTSAGNAYFQFRGGGTLLVEGGTFNEGTIGALSVAGTGNAFNVTAGTANLNNGFTVSAGLNTAISGTGTLNVTSGGTNVNNNGTLAVSGTSNVTLGDALVVSAGGTFTVSGGTVGTTGALTVQSATTGATPVAGGSFNMSGGNLTVANGITLQANAGNTALTGGTINVSAGDFTINSALTLANTTVNFAGGRFAVAPNGAGSFTMSSGLLNMTKGEFNYDNNNVFLSGGQINAPLVTGANGAGTTAGTPSTYHTLNISGGVLNLTGTNYNGIYGGGATQYINLLAGSTGLIDFSNGDSDSVIKAFITSNVIEYNNTPYDPATGYSNFMFGTDANSHETLSVVVPEPTTVLGGALLLGAFGWSQRRKLRAVLA